MWFTWQSLSWVQCWYFVCSSCWGYTFVDWGLVSHCEILLLCTTSLSPGFPSAGEYKKKKRDVEESRSELVSIISFCLLSCFQLVEAKVCWKKPTGMFLKIHAQLSNAMLSNRRSQGRGMDGSGSQAGAQGAESHTWLLPPNTTAHYVYVIGSGSAVWEVLAPCALRVMMQSSYRAALYEWRLQTVLQLCAASYFVFIPFFSVLAQVFTHKQAGKHTICHASHSGCLYFKYIPILYLHSSENEPNRAPVIWNPSILIHCRTFIPKHLFHV